MIIAEVLASVVCVPSHSELLCYIAACGKGNIGNALVANCNIPSIDNDCVSSLAVGGYEKVVRRDRRGA